MDDFIFPRRCRGRPSARASATYRQQVEEFCAAILKINSTLDFSISARGWCYILEEHGLYKGDFDLAETLINDCRKSGDLPLNICGDDERRAAEHLETLHDSDPTIEAESLVDYVQTAYQDYLPVSFWEEQAVYLEMLVEKIDLKSLFSGICAPFHLALANGAGWNDLNSRAAMMRRFAHWQAKGKRCVLLYCGDHDPGGLHISDFIKSNMADMSRAVGWSPDNLEIDRFGLNADFIEAQNLTWIENLETASGKSLADPNHNDHSKPYVQNYIRQFGVRKVEANALVTRPAAGRELCRRAILKYLSAHAPAQFASTLELAREELRREIERLLEERAP